jgi:hypothetical protein
MWLKKCFGALLVVLFWTGCASEPEFKRDRIRDRHSRRSGFDPWGKGEVTGDDKAMGMHMSVGFLDERAVDRAIKPYERSMVRCFERAGDARKYLSGQVAMRFFVNENGEVTQVNVVKNALGSYPVERCLIGVGMRIAFPQPEGGKGTDFEYSLGFHSTGERNVVPLNGIEMARHLTGIASDLASCGSLSPEGVDVIAYVEPGGLVGSVGFVSQAPIDPTAATCAATLMRRVRVPGASSARSTIVLRATFPMSLAYHKPGGEVSRRAKGNRRRL